jgi:hypothetical protein
MVLFCLFAGKFVDPIAVPIFIHKGEPGRPAATASHARPVSHAAQYPPDAACRTRL